MRYVSTMQTADAYMPMPKRKPVMFYASPALHAALMELARREGESASMLLRRATKQMVEAARHDRMDAVP